MASANPDSQTRLVRSPRQPITFKTGLKRKYQNPFFFNSQLCCKDLREVSQGVLAVIYVLGVPEKLETVVEQL